MLTALVAKSGKDFKELALEIFDVLPDGEISLEVVSTSAEDMIREAHTLLTWAPKVGVFSEGGRTEGQNEGLSGVCAQAGTHTHDTPVGKGWQTPWPNPNIRRGPVLHYCPPTPTSHTHAHPTINQTGDCQGLHDP